MEDLDHLEFEINRSDGQPTLISGDMSMVRKWVLSARAEGNTQLPSTVVSGSPPSIAFAQSPLGDDSSALLHEYNFELDKPDQDATYKNRRIRIPNPQGSIPISQFSELAGWNLRRSGSI